MWLTHTGRGALNSAQGKRHATISAWLEIDCLPRRRGQMAVNFPTTCSYTPNAMRTLTRITADPAMMGGRPCIRGIRVTVGTIVGLLASGHSHDDILRLYPYLDREDITEALAYAAWRSDEFEVPISPK